ARVVLHREDEDLHVWMLVEDLGRHLDPALPAEDDVHEHDVGLGAPGLEDRLAGVARLAHRLDVIFRAEEHAQPGPDDGVVVDDEDTDAAQGSGTATTTVGPGARGRSTRRVS